MRFCLEYSPAMAGWGPRREPKRKHYNHELASVYWCLKCVLPCYYLRGVP
jgi:hypothetical protein